MTPNSGVQVFRYPRFRDAWFKVPVEFWLGTYAVAIFGMIACGVFLALHHESYLSLIPGVATNIYAQRLLWSTLKMRNGHLELTADTLTRYFGDGTAVTLASDDLLYSIVDDTYIEHKNLALTSRVGNLEFFILDTIENFSELQDIISSRATRSFKDSKRGQLSTS